MKLNTRKPDHYKKMELIKNSFIAESRSNKYNRISSLVYSFLNYYRRNVNSYLNRDEFSVLCENNNNKNCIAQGITDILSLTGFDTCIKSRMTLNDLKKSKVPLILKVSPEIGKYEYVIYYGYDGRYLIGDPSIGLIYYTDYELRAIWESSTLILVEPRMEEIRSFDQKQDRGSFVKSLKSKELIFNIVVLIAISIVTSTINILVLHRLFSDSIIYTDQISSIVWNAIIVITCLLLNRGFFFFVNKFPLKILSKIDALFLNNFLNRKHPKAEILDSFVSLLYHNELSNSLKTVFYSAFILLPVIIYCFFQHDFEESIFIITAVELGLYSLFFYFFIKRYIDEKQNLYLLALRNLRIAIKGLSNLVSYDNPIIYKVRGRNILPYEYYIRNVNIHKRFQNFNLYFIVINVFIILFLQIVFSYFDVTEQKINHIPKILGFLLQCILIIVLSKIVISSIDLRAIFYCLSKIPQNWDSAENNNALTSQQLVVNSIEFRNVEFNYPGQETIFKNISFSIEKKSLNVFIGDNSTGKTTIIKMLQGKLRPVSGSIIINGESTEKITDDYWKNQIYTVDMRSRLFPGTLKENICHKQEVKSDQFNHFVKFYGLSSFFNLFSNSYETLVSDGDNEISFSQQKVILLARTLFKNPLMLVIEDPFSGLDNDLTDLVKNILLIACKKTIVVLTSLSSEKNLPEGKQFVIYDKSICLR